MDEDNPYLSRVSRIGEVGRRAERKSARRLGAKLTPASGAAQSKGDMIKAEFLIEHKATIKASLSLQRDWLEKIEREAYLTGKQPALMVSFQHPSGHDHPAGRWVLVQESFFKELNEK
jgi:hypothetical protein